MCEDGADEDEDDGLDEDEDEEDEDDGLGEDEEWERGSRRMLPRKLVGSA